MEHKKEGRYMRLIHTILGIAIMFFFRYLPVQLPHITSVGMQVLGIFFGTLYLWTTTDPLWSSLFSVTMLGLSDYATMNEVLAAFGGNPIIVQMFFIMVLMEALVYSGLTSYLGRFFLKLRFIQGRPWIFTFTIMTGAYIMSIFISPFTPIFLFWPVMYEVFEQLGYEKKDRYPAISLILIVLASIAGFPVAPYMGNALALLSNYRTISGQLVISDGGYFIVSFLLGITMLAVTILIAKYIFHPDTKKLKDMNVDQLIENPLPPLSRSQKIMGVGFAAYILLMVIPSLLPNLPGMTFLSKNSYGWGIVVIAIGGAIHVEGKPVIEFTKVMKNNFAWPVFFLCGTAILLGTVLTDKTTGISVFLNTILSPIFQDMNLSVFLCIFLGSTVILTNFCNSLVIGMILEPVLLTYCNTAGINSAPLITLLIFTVLSMAVVTPAASPFAALLFGNKEWLSAKDVYKYAMPTVILEVVCILLISIPVVNFII